MKIKRVLVVDDDGRICESLARAFSAIGMEAFWATGSNEAVEIARQHRFDLAVIDLFLGKVSGLDLARSLRRTYPRTRIVILTGYGSIKTAVQAMLAGAVSYVEKPASPKDILDAIASADRELALSQGRERLIDVERSHVERVLRESGGNISQAAKRLGIHRRSLQRMLKRLSLDS